MIRVERMRQKDADAKQSKKCCCYLNHRTPTHPSRNPVEPADQIQVVGLRRVSLKTGSRGFPGDQAPAVSRVDGLPGGKNIAATTNHGGIGTFVTTVAGHSFKGPMSPVG